MKLSVIIPAYNEEKRISSTLSSYLSYFESLRKSKELDYELIVVINGTTDKTEEIVKKFRKKNSRLKYLNLKMGGKGYAVIEGFKEALKGKSEILAFADADMATSPQELYSLVSNINGSDAVIASRYIKGAKVRPKPKFQRIIVSRIFNVLIRILFLMPYRDTQCGAKAFKRKAIADIMPHLTMSQWAFDVEIIYNLRKKGYSVREIPTIWSDKKYSTINFMKAGPMMALGIIRLRLANSPFRGVVKIYNRFHRTIFK